MSSDSPLKATVHLTGKPGSRGWGHSHVSGEDAIDEVLLGQMEGTLQLIIVEGDLSRAGAVEPGLQEGSPLLLQHSWRAAHVILAHTGHSRHHHLDKQQAPETP